MILETINVGALEVNCYVLASSPGGRAIIIDPGDQEHKIKAVLEKYKLIPEMVINTHGHYDHIAADDAFGVTVYVHKNDLPMLQDARKNLSAAFAVAGYQVSSKIKTLSEGQLIKVQDLELEVIHLPGHTPGGIGLLMRKPQDDIVFTGDTLFCMGVGRWDLPGGSQKMLEAGIREKLFILPVATKVYPGHGSSTTIGREKERSSFRL